MLFLAVNQHKNHARKQLDKKGHHNNHYARSLSLPNTDKRSDISQKSNERQKSKSQPKMGRKQFDLRQKHG